MLAFCSLLIELQRRGASPMVFDQPDFAAGRRRATSPRAWHPARSL